MYFNTEKLGAIASHPASFRLPPLRWRPPSGTLKMHCLLVLYHNPTSEDVCNLVAARVTTLVRTRYDRHHPTTLVDEGG